MQNHHRIGIALLALIMAAPLAWAVDFDRQVDLTIAAQPLSTALVDFSKQAQIQVISAEMALEARRADELKGRYSVRDALTKLLEGTGLAYSSVGPNTIAVVSTLASGAARGEGAGSVRVAQVDGNGETAGSGVAEPSPSQGEGQGEDAKQQTVEKTEAEQDPERAGIPEILVTGSKLRSLNMDVKRSPDDAQPYVVFDREDIEQSGSVNLDDFLRNQLTMSVNAYSSALGANPEGNRSSINLRGLGTDETLILIDGHRIAGFNREGFADQPDINGIPLGAIERIEVLPTTASGIYGGGATGGAINIVLRRDYAGIETKLTYGNTFASDVANRRFDVSAGYNFEGGRSNLLVAGSYSEANPLLTQERNFVQRGRQHVLQNNPGVYLSSRTPPLGATTNIRSTTGENLTLKDGTPLNAAITHVPRGYGGPATDNGFGLLSGAGNYNFDLANTAQNEGGQKAIANAPTVSSMMLTLRRDFTPSVRAFLELNVSSNAGRFAFSRSNSVNNLDGVVIPATAPTNPFQQAIRVTVPALGVDTTLRSDSKNRRLVGGLVFNLPAEWQMETDLTWHRSQFSYFLPGGISPTVRSEISNGSLDVLRDINDSPAQFATIDEPFAGLSPAETTLKNATVRIAGSLPLALPAGRPTVAALLERRDESYESATQTILGQPFLIPERSQSVDSAYLETKVPIISAMNRITGFNALELQLAVRRDAYSVTGATSRIDLTNPSPIVRMTNRNSSADPTIGLRYEPMSDLVLRTSFGTGYLPPAVSQLLPDVPTSAPLGLLGVTDPMRGNEPLGEVAITVGGNPNLRPEASESWSAGAILTPQITPGLRVSADWSVIRKTDNVASILPLSQRGLQDILTLAPDRITRAPASDGFEVGPITAIDATLINIAELRVKALDVALDYQRDIRKLGQVDMSIAASRLVSLETQLTRSSESVENAGVSGGFGDPNQIGGLKWKAMASLNWSYGNLTLGWRTRFFDSYFLNSDHSVVSSQGGATVPSQTYHDFWGKYTFNFDTSTPLQGIFSNTEITFVLNNILDDEPPVDVTGGSRSAYFSPWGDSRLASYFISVRKNFSLRE